MTVVENGDDRPELTNGNDRGKKGLWFATWKSPRIEWISVETSISKTEEFRMMQT